MVNGIEEQKVLIKKMLSSQPDSWVVVGGVMISHPNLSQVFCFTDSFGGFTANDHNGVSRDWLYAPVEFDVPSVTGNMDAEFSFTVSDLNEDGTSLGSNIAIIDILDAIGETEILPKLTVLSYISYEDGTFSEYCDGPYEYEISNIDFNETGARITAKSPDALYAGCGIKYTIKDFKMLRQYL